jgi:hypothetical protein
VKAERSRASQRAGRHRTGLASLAARVVESLGGRYSVELGIDVDANEDEIERWALAATLFGARISATIAERTFAILEQAGVRSIADAGRRDVGTLIELLDAGGYARYDLRTAERLHAIARALETDRDGRVSSAFDLPADQLESALDALPGWGPVTVGLFLRELRGVRPGISPPLDRRAAQAGEHLGLLAPGAGVVELCELAAAAQSDARDLEAALVRLSLAHGRRMRDCPGGRNCTLITAPS